MDYDLEFVTGDAVDHSTDMIVFFVSTNNEDDLDLEHVPSLRDEPLSDFHGKEKETQVFYEGDFSATKLALVGFGRRGELDLNDLTEVAGVLPDLAGDHSVDELTVVFPLYLDMDRKDIAKLITFGLYLGGYRFENYKHTDDENEDKDTELERVELLLEDRRSKSTVREGFGRGESLSKSVKYSRDLANTPANHLVPEDIAKRARSLAREYKHVTAEVEEEDELRENDMNLILAVGKGSENPPRFVKLKYEAPDPKESLALAGKGVTFDTGGISIKPSKKMGEMKFDMCGAAAVLGVVKACAELELPIQLHGLVPTAENMPSDRAVKPGDVVTGYHGKSVEILNTDAEGRLLLADALGYASKELAEDIDCLIDFATLTGACITALGHHAAGLMGIDDALCESLMEAGERSNEPVWQLPLWDDYSEELESDVADVKNIGGDAGAITAGAFLREFVDEEAIEQWAHLDIAGTGWAMPELSYRSSGGTGFGVHLVHEFLRSRYSLDN